MTGPVEVSFRAGDATLGGTLTLPAVEGRAPWVVLVGSWLPRDRGGGWDRARHPTWFDARRDVAPGLFTRLAEALAARGVATFRYDPRGCGASDGTWESTDLFTRIDDARDAIGAMRSRSELDLRRGAILGHGEGAVIALSVAIGDPAVAAVGLVGPSARGFRDVLRRGVAERARTGRDRDHPLVAAIDRSVEELIERADRREPTLALDVSGEEVRLALAGWEQAFHTPPIALATMLHRDVVIAHGSEDAWTDPSESELMAETLRRGGNDPVVHLLAGGGHDLTEAADETLDAFAGALAERIRPRELPPVLLAIEEMHADR
jgi:hypothetical protein